MLNLEAREVRLQPILVPETPKKNVRIPSWLRVPAFTIRTSLAILTATPGMVVAVDTINHIDKSAIVYDSGRNVTVNPPYNLDPIPTPSATAQPLEVYELYLNSHWYVIRGFRDESNFKGDFPIDKTRIIAKWGATDIRLQAGQVLEISATGRVRLQGADYVERHAINCNNSMIIDPDGYRYWRDTVCPPDKQSQMASIKGAPIGMLIGSIDGPGYNRSRFLIGSHRKERVDRDGELKLQINYGTLASTSGGFDITVTVYTPERSIPPAVPVATPIAVRKIELVTTPERGSDLQGWLLGLGSTLLVGLASYKLYERWKVGRGVGAQATAGTASSVGTAFRIGGAVGALPGSSNPNTAPNFGPTQQKSLEWKNGQQEFEKRWLAAKSKFPNVRSGDTGNEPEYILERFKSAMNIVHEVSLDSTASVSLMAILVRAGIEYLIPQIWPNNRILKRFFDPNFNAGFLTNEDLAKILYLPEHYRSLSSFTDQQRRDMHRIRRILMFALHPDKFQLDSDKSLQDSIEDLLKKLNQSWSYIEKLIK